MPRARSTPRPLPLARRDAAGNALAANFTWQFHHRRGPGHDAPDGVLHVPGNAATGVALNSSVSATFSEAMTNATLTTASFTLATTAGGAAVTGTVSVSGNTATFTPSAALAGKHAVHRDHHHRRERRGG